jgi:hypothetical protein
MGVAAPLPFPGIQQLLIASHYMLAVVVLLFPLFFLLPERRGNSPSAVSDYCPWIFLCYVSIIFILSMDATAAMRAAVQVALTFSFPYLFLRRAMSNQKDVEIFVQAIVVVAMILFCITSVAAAKQWDFYRVNVPSSVFSIPASFNHGIDYVGGASVVRKSEFYAASCNARSDSSCNIYVRLSRRPYRAGPCVRYFFHFDAEKQGGTGGSCGGRGGCRADWGCCSFDWRFLVDRE